MISSHRRTMKSDLSRSGGGTVRKNSDNGRADNETIAAEREREREGETRVRERETNE